MTALAPRGSADRVVATVAGRVITESEVEARLAAIGRGPLSGSLPTPGPEDRRWRRWVVRLLVTEGLVRHESGIEAEATQSGDLARPTANGADPDQAARLAAAARSIFDRITAEVVVGEHELHDYYLRNLDRFRREERRQVRHVLVAKADLARELRRRLDAGEDIAPMAEQHSLDRGSRHRGGMLGEVRRGELAGEFEEAVFGARPGAMVGPVRTEFGWHLAQVTEVTPGGHEPFEEVRQQIAAHLLGAARGRAFEHWLEERRRAVAWVDPEWGHPGDPSLPDFFHRH